ncbi:MAG TPA: sigma-70 family RNA polymerase sigma factor, partial [Gaiellaceae bacterium]|nr:sigma-70 family RNA polymerase sigma factor [Gaiellaceae bacterium]
MGRPPETEYVERAKRGDHDAYESLLRMHEHVAFRTAYAIVGSAADAEEVAQDAFVKAYRALHRFRPGSPFRPWLLRIVANEARNRRRTVGRRARLLDRAAAEEAASGGAAPSPEAGVIASEQRDELLAALA